MRVNELREQTMMDGRYGEQFGSHSGFHWGVIVMLAALIALVAITVLVIRALERNRIGGAPAAGATSTNPGVPASPAQDVLRTRLANGEIDVAEYRERMAALLETS